MESWTVDLIYFRRRRPGESERDARRSGVCTCCRDSSPWSGRRYDHGEHQDGWIVRRGTDDACFLRLRADIARAGLVATWAGFSVAIGAAFVAVAGLRLTGIADDEFERAGNALATHDIESALYGTSLGVDLQRGHGVEHGHEHHIRAINQIRKAGSIAKAVEQDVLTGGVMHALVRQRKEFVLVGSVRDDGPLPDVYTDVIDGQRAMRAKLKDVGFCLMVATMLHSVATGNILPASIPLVCVDINPATVTKLADRGSSQARGIVTDVGLFLEQLAHELVPDYRRP